MQRHFDWEERLALCVQACDEKVWRPGAWDCALFVLDCVDAMTGSAQAAMWRGHYESVDVGLTLAGGDLARQCTRLFGKPMAPTLAQRGDVVLLQEGALAICVGEMCWTVTEGVGLEAVPMAQARRAWRV
jgi:hypothetical protein